MNKRGLSPVLATILLIAFAVAIGAMIISFTSGVVKEAQTCNDIPEDIINQDAFCRLQDKVVPRVPLENGNYEACSEHEIIVSSLPLC